MSAGVVHGPTKGLRAVHIWLLTGCLLIACMVLIGGVTRLTGSGLSITEWNPIMGALPPMNAEEWNSAFEKYKRIPEYRLVNQHMDIGGFKHIFFWEYLHRNWGRLMGLVFFVPFCWFWRQGRLQGWLLSRCLAILVAGGCVGALGWYMVASGLVERPDVSHFRLAIHLCAAFAVFSLVWWTALDLRVGARTFRSSGSTLGQLQRALLVLLGLQIVWGAFTAGLNAGTIYTTWPLMNGEFMPANVHAFGNWVKNFTDHKDGVQFVHRNLAWLVAAATVGISVHYRKTEAMRGVWVWLLVAVLMQFMLGVATLLTQVQIVLGALHQMGALVLLAALLSALHATGQERALPPAQRVREVLDVRP
jgi:heme a synthase